METIRISNLKDWLAIYITNEINETTADKDESFNTWAKNYNLQQAKFAVECETCDEDWKYKKASDNDEININEAKDCASNMIQHILDGWYD